MDQIYDIAVVGAGPSGIAAASYAAKFGAKVALFEKNSIIGGTALKANVNTLSGGSISSMDGLLYGITKKAWGSVLFHPDELLDKYYSLLKKYNVPINCGYTAISVKTDDNGISSIVFSTGTGKTSIFAKIIIDATGIQEIENLTGTKDIGYAQYCYMSGLIGKVETVGGKCYGKEAKNLIKEKISYSKSTGQFSPDLFIEIQPTVRADIALLVIKQENSDIINGSFMRERMNEAVDFLQDFGYGFENASLIVSSKDIFYSAQGISSAKYTLSLEDITQNKYFNDQVAALPDDDGDDDRVYYIPYGSILSAKFDNLLLCGRNIGATTNAMDQIDSIPTHFETGKAAGIAAAIAIKVDLPLDSVSPYEIISKSQDSVTQKIEILNEIVGEEELATPVALNIIEDDNEEVQSVPLVFSHKQEEADDFKSLDDALSRIDESETQENQEFIPEATKELTEEVTELIDDIDLIMDIDKESIVKKIEPEPESAESIITKMAGFTNLVDVFSPEISENEVSEDKIEDLIIESLEDDSKSTVASASVEVEDTPEVATPSDILSEIFQRNQDVLDLESNQDASVESDSDDILATKNDTLQEDILVEAEKSIAVDIAEDEEIVNAISDDASKTEPNFDTDADKENIKDLKEPENTVSIDPPQNNMQKSTEKPAVSLSDFVFSSIEDTPKEKSQETEQEMAKEDIVATVVDDVDSANDKVVSEPIADDTVATTDEATAAPIVDDTVEPTDEATTEPIVDDKVAINDDIPEPKLDNPPFIEHQDKEKSLAEELEVPKDIVTSNDVLSMLYKQNEQEAAKKATNHKPVKNIAQDELSLLYDSGDIKPKTSRKASNDKTSVMLDMIYEITDNNESKLHTKEHSDLPNQWISNAPKNNEDKKFLSDDKFKSIKDFLYDSDND